LLLSGRDDRAGVVFRQEVDLRHLREDLLSARQAESSGEQLQALLDRLRAELLCPRPEALAVLPHRERE
jgi:hypothetical protein